VCGTPGAIETVRRDRLPAMQNYVHRSREHALAAPQGAFSLAVCAACGHGWNAAFDPSRLTYDDSYDNAVPSAVMARYYDEIADYLGRKYELAQGYVVDIGCGDGTFLKALARVWPQCRGLGVDPALPGDSRVADGRVRLVKGVFAASQLEAAPSLFLSRHVLEHMPEPVAFVRTLRDTIGDRAGVPLFVEVPELDWIVRNDAFWDFCYEHCNYFGEASLREVFARAGFEPIESRVAFGGQYRWIEGVTPGAGQTPVGGADASRAPGVAAYAARERDEIDGAHRRLLALKAGGAAIAIWGMATKGILYSLLVDPASTLVDVAVDINANKQGCFVPTTGRRIEAPADLQRVAGGRVAVVVMNTNYVEEIRGTCGELGIAAEFLDAGGRPVAP
jgi:SAM-dependent methyltransferase